MCFSNFETIAIETIFIYIEDTVDEEDDRTIYAANKNKNNITITLNYNSSKRLFLHVGSTVSAHLFIVNIIFL